MAKSVKQEFNKFLKELDRNGLEKEIQKLYSKFKNVKEYYEMELTGDTTKLLEEYKSKIKKEYFPSRGYGKARSSVSRKVVTDFKKIAIFQKDVIDLILYRVEMMIGFTNAYGDIDEPFYNSIESSFDEACKLIAKEKLEDEFEIYCKDLIKSTYNFGWGLSDGMEYSYDLYFSK